MSDTDDFRTALRSLPKEKLQELLRQGQEAAKSVEIVEDDAAAIPEKPVKERKVKPKKSVASESLPPQYPPSIVRKSTGHMYNPEMAIAMRLADVIEKIADKPRRGRKLVREPFSSDEESEEEVREKLSKVSIKKTAVPEVPDNVTYFTEESSGGGGYSSAAAASGRGGGYKYNY